MRFYKRIWLFAFFPLVIGACGIDDEPYLSPIPPSNIVVSFNTGARISVSTPSYEEPYSPSYFLYYKIYTSAANETSTILPGTDEATSPMKQISGTLASDYHAMKSYTTANASTVNMFTPTIFSSRNFYTMVIGSKESFSAKSVSTVTIDFSSGGNPSVRQNSGNAETVYRSNGGGSFTPRPDDRSFRNFTELRESQNLDVAVTTGNYAYCAVYIIKQGINPNTLSAIYSTPTYVTVFRLPESY
jgi:hypothetical protein